MFSESSPNKNRSLSFNEKKLDNPKSMLFKFDNLCVDTNNGSNDHDSKPDLYVNLLK